MGISRRAPRSRTFYSQGFSLVELIIGSALFALIALSVYQGYVSLTTLVSLSRVKITATDLINEQFELVRNLPYDQVGLLGGIPPGVLLPTETFVRDTRTFTLTRTIRNIDDPFDGLIGGSPNDLSPADYKLVELTLECTGCKNFETLSATTRVSPRNLETASTNGALFIRVFDGNGEPVPGAQVHVENNIATTSIVIDDVTDAQGMLQIVDAPPGAAVYEITVTKPGYTTDQTYAPTVANPNPAKRHATVLIQQVTQVSFVIDRVSVANISTITPTCTTVPSVPFTMKGSKLIGTTPDVYKFDQSFSTDSSGIKILSNLEWDTYSITLNSSSHYLAGVNPLLPVSVLPDAVQDIQLILTADGPSQLLVTVKDSATNLPLSGVLVTLEDGSFSESLITGRGFLEQTDWSGGSGQTNFVDQTQYFSSDGNIDTGNPVGTLALNSSFGIYVPSGELTSSTFDTGTTTNFNQVSWTPLSQPAQTGAGNVRIQFATSPENTATTTWTFRGPDGTGSSFYDVSDTNVHSIHNGDRFFRYKTYLATASTTATPTLANVAFTFTSSCIPPGQVMFSDLNSATYTMTLTKSGYATQQIQVPVTSLWQQQEAVLIPQ